MKRTILATLAIVSFGLSAWADEPYIEPVKAYVSANVSPLLSNSEVVGAVKAHNLETAAMGSADIEKLDNAWRAEAEAGSGPTVDRVLSSELSKKLAEIRESSNGVITEIFIMDAKGLNVAQSDLTSDFWQGDEAKYEKSYGAGAGAVFVDEIEKDESTQSLQTQVSLTIVDPADSKPIGAVTVGIDVDKL